jgi:AcrR family transcriptional regulator
MKKNLRPTEAGPADAALCNRIIEAAFETIMKKGYFATSMLDIATRAKVSKRDLYATYPHKQAVVAATIASRAARTRLPDLPAPTSRQELAQTLVAYGRVVLREVSQPAVAAMFRLAIAEAERSPDVADALKVNRLASRKSIADFLANAQTNGILQAGDPKQMSELYFALLWGDLQLDRLLGSDIPNPAEIERRARRGADAFLRLFAPEPREIRSE